MGCFEKDCYVFFWLSLSCKEIVVFPTDELFLRLVNLVDCQVDQIKFKEENNPSRDTYYFNTANGGVAW